MKESSKILLYGLLASVLLILLCLYAHQDEFMTKEKISTTETEEFIDHEMEKKEEFSSPMVSKSIEKQKSDQEEPTPQKASENISTNETVVDEKNSENQETDKKDEELSSEEENESIEKKSTSEKALFKDKAHVQLKEHPKVEKKEKAADVADKNLPIEDNKPLIDNDSSKEKKSQVSKKSEVKKVAHKSLKKGKKASISSIQEKVSSVANRNISFYKGKAQITSKGKKTLNKLIPLLKKVPNAKIIVKGYTDASGKESVNLWISQERAKSVKKYLVKHGIPLKNIIAKGYGESELLYGDKPYSKLNRRVEIELKKGK